ncbi:hypothetical protein FA15DRAFT_758591 [Coprinopsis marcescibilis]|uniref:Small nuclear ribonucleoprotein Prp3 C-terminal domain-containing protein n=1 Tax=Coprinopsis marcescibilis TaxID=230819 RepID=A0A5C3KNM9_COPMA|nr:hypothetical protein FA15DRAFT_758591 [Coprinopsis marcescibilis]
MTSVTTELVYSRLSELQMIYCSLLPPELMEFMYDSPLWTSILSNSGGFDVSVLSGADIENCGSVTFTLKVENVKKIWLQVTMPVWSNSGTTSQPDKPLSGVTISVKSDVLSRAEIDNWQLFVKEKMIEEEEGTEFALYNLISSHLFPLLHEYEGEQVEQGPANISDSRVESSQTPIHHVLFSSHHLISPKKRRSLQQWTSSLSLSGFAKVGYPGIIYAQGPQDSLEEFVANVRAMQWLALKVRFFELLPERYKDGPVLAGWREFQRVGEVVEEMKAIGRGEYVFEMGIGSAHE